MEVILKFKTDSIFPLDKVFKISVDKRIESLVSDLFTGKILSLSDGGLVQGISYHLRDLRKAGLLTIARDFDKKTTLIFLNHKPKEVEKKRFAFGGANFLITL